jgi:hypothetical protein
MANFLNKIFGDKTKKPAAMPEKLAEIACPGSDFSVIVEGMDSTLGINGKDCFIRRYPLSLKAPTPEAIAKFISEHNADPRSIQPDGSLRLKTIPGDLLIGTQWLDTLTENLADQGVKIPDTQIWEAISKDMAKYKSTFYEPMAPAEKQGAVR